jgi:hypothetical protein
MFRRLFFLIGISLLFPVSSLSAGQVFTDVSDVRDPTRPAQFSNADVESALSSRMQGLNLVSTLISPCRAIAIINGQIFQQGQMLEGMEIVAIEPGAVRLRHDGGALWLYTTAGIEKKPSTSEGNLH